MDSNSTFKTLRAIAKGILHITRNITIKSLKLHFNLSIKQNCPE